MKLLQKYLLAPWLYVLVLLLHMAAIDTLKTSVADLSVSVNVLISLPSGTPEAQITEVVSTVTDLKAKVDAKIASEPAPPTVPPVV